MIVSECLPQGPKGSQEDPQPATLVRGQSKSFLPERGGHLSHSFRELGFASCAKDVHIARECSGGYRTPFGRNSLSSFVPLVPERAECSLQGEDEKSWADRVSLWEPSRHTKGTSLSEPRHEESGLPPIQQKHCGTDESAKCSSLEELVPNGGPTGPVISLGQFGLHHVRVPLPLDSFLEGLEDQTGEFAGLVAFPKAD